LWSIDSNGEPWLGDDEASDNPYVMVANPKRQRKGRRKGVMPAGLRRYWATHRRKSSSARRNPPAARRAPARRRSKVTWMRRNPGTGIARSGAFLSRFPDLATVGGVTLGFAAPGIITAQVTRFLPASIMQSPLGMWAVKAAAAVVPPLLLRKMGQARLATNMLIGGVVSLAVDFLRSYFPTYLSGMGSQPMLGYYTPGPVSLLAAGAARTQIARVGRGMGMYTPNVYPPAGRQTNAVATVPERLAPGSRF